VFNTSQQGGIPRFEDCFFIVIYFLLADSEMGLEVLIIVFDIFFFHSDLFDDPSGGKKKLD